MSSEKRSKPSGASFRKKRKLVSEENKKLSSSLKKCCNTVMPEKEKIHQEDQQICSSNDVQIRKNTIEESLNDSSVNLEFDPSNWPQPITDDVRIMLVKKGPINPDEDFIFPLNGNKRHFTANCFKKKLKNGEQINRPWLLYSRKTDKIFCFTCKLFSQSIMLTTTGFNDWRNLHQTLREHETSRSHILAVKN